MLFHILDYYISKIIFEQSKQQIDLEKLLCYNERMGNEHIFLINKYCLKALIGAEGIGFK